MRFGLNFFPAFRPSDTTHLLLDPLELIEKLAVLVPAPRVHLLHYHGVPPGGL